MPHPCLVWPLFLSVALASFTAVAAEAPQTPPSRNGLCGPGDLRSPCGARRTPWPAFSELVIRVKESSEILVVKSGIKQDILEELRHAGLKVFGGESLVFNRDESSKARFALGGTLDELECSGMFRSSCRIGIAWELLDREADRVVYRVRTRAVARAHLSRRPAAAQLDRRCHSLPADASSSTRRRHQACRAPGGRFGLRGGLPEDLPHQRTENAACLEPGHRRDGDAGVGYAVRQRSRHLA